MSLGDINVKLNLDGKDFTLGIYRADKLVRQLSKSVDSTSKSVRRSHGVLYQWGRNIRDVSLTLAALPYALHTLNNVFLTLPTSIVRANAQMERMNQLMIGLSSETKSLAAAQEDAKKKMGFLTDLADRTPYDLETLTDGMVKFTSVGLDPMAGGFEALIDSVAKFGGTSQHLHRSYIAIQQMAGKGVISMEELRQQLGEAVPDAINIMARGMGISMGELAKKVSLGIVESQNALNAMFNQMAIENSGAAEEMAQTWDGMMNRLRTRWLLAQKELGDGGAFQELKNILQEVLDLTSDPRFLQFMTDAGENLARLIAGIKEAVVTIYEYRDAIQFLLVAYAGLKLANNDLIRSAGGGLRNGLQAASASLTAYSANVRSHRAEIERLSQHQARMNASFTAGTNTLVQHAVQQKIVSEQAAIMAARKEVAAAAFTRMTNAIRAASTALATSLGPAAAFTAAMWAIHHVLDKLYLAEKRWQSVREDNKLAFSVTELKAYRNELDSLQAKRGTILDRMRKQKQGYFWIDETAEEFEKNLAEIEQKISKQQELITASLSQQAEFAGRNAADVVVRNLNSNIRQISRTYSEASKAIQQAQAVAPDQYTNEYVGEIMATLRAEYKEKALAEIQAQVDAAQSLLDSMRSGQDKGFNTLGTDQKTIAIAKQEEILKALGDEYERTSALQTETFNLNTIANQNGGTPLERLLQRTTVKLAGLKAGLDDASGEVAKFQARMNGGEFGEVGEEDRKVADQIMAQLREIDRLNAAKERTKQITKEIESAEKVIANQLGRINAESEQLNGSSNPWFAMSTGAKQLEKSIAQIREKFNGLGNVSAAYRKQMEAVYASSEKALEAQKNLDFGTAMKKMADETKKLNSALMTQEEQLQTNHFEAILYLEEFKKANAELIAQNPEMLKVFDSYKEALDKQYRRETEHVTETVLREWSDTSEAMDRVWRSAMEGMSKSLTDFLVRGKGDFGDFLEDIVAMLVQAQLNKYIAGALGGGNILGTLVSGIGGIFGLGADATGAINTSGFNHSAATLNQLPAAFATGGIMTEHGKASLRKYANGGIAHSPQIALYGEGSQPEAYVPLPDGKTIPVTMQGGAGANVEINVINQSGQAMQAEEAGRRFDGERMILDVVMKAATRPGAFQSTLKGALK